MKKWLLSLLISLWIADSAQARQFRVNRIPNGTSRTCSNCHVNPGGGGTRTPFGAAVYTAIGGTSSDVAFWTPALAALDSDNDGRTNGQELNDPEGDFTTTGSSGVTNPGNRPPVFTSTPPTIATRGILLSYLAASTDGENNPRTYTKVSGPTWLNVTTTGTVSGTPLASTPASVEVSLRVTDNATSSTGSSGTFATQTFTLTTQSSFAGWQALNFTLPSENALAVATADPDGDGLSNFEEYARVLPPKVPSSAPALDFTTQEPWMISMVCRDDDPKLKLRLRPSADLIFSSSPELIAEVTDPVTTDGVKTWTFTDPGEPSTVRRFWKIEFSQNP